MEQIEELPPTTRPEPAAPTTTFEALYVLEYRPMVRLAFVLLGRDGPAEETVQDAFARVYERWDSLQAPGGYLRTCVVNGCRDVLRRRRMAVWKRPDPAPLSSELGADHLSDALAELPARRRAAVVLRYYCDLSEAEIAATLGVRPGTVKSMLHRSLIQLRGVIER
ncbi:MAG TPA: SigE family RNA polymerase sigma factor [Acidimicrobiales bacterium]|nr:SigE family RNA polymerase sigma factor [Acidimicrobiales bacterium]